MEGNSRSVQEHTRTKLQIIADQGWVLACYFEVMSWLLPPTSSISKYGSMGEYSTDYLVRVTGAHKLSSI